MARHIAAGWMGRAACKGMDPALFFPEPYQGAKGRPVCLRCPVRWECLDYALVAMERGGIWGGHNDGERALIRKLRLEDSSVPLPLLSQRSERMKRP